MKAESCFPVGKKTWSSQVSLQWSRFPLLVNCWKTWCYVCCFFLLSHEILQQEFEFFRWYCWYYNKHVLGKWKWAIGLMSWNSCGLFWFFAFILIGFGHGYVIIILCFASVFPAAAKLCLALKKVDYWWKNINWQLWPASRGLPWNEHWKTGQNLSWS